MSTRINPPRHIVWSTDSIDRNDPYQRRWFLAQTLIYGTAADIRRLDKDELARELDFLRLPPVIERLWRTSLASRDE